MKRFTISLDDDLAVQLDRLMKERNYSNRSEVFRDILRDIIAKEDLTRGDAEALAVVSYSFNHHKRQLTDCFRSPVHQRSDNALHAPAIKPDSILLK